MLYCNFEGIDLQNFSEDLNIGQAQHEIAILTIAELCDMKNNYDPTPVNDIT